MNLFMLATRKAWRFPSIRGELTTEQLWSLPLTSKVGFDLGSVGVGILDEVEKMGRRSLVDTTSNPAKEELEQKLDLIKAIIAVKQEEAAAAAKKAGRAEERRKLLDALAAKETAELSSASKEDILKRLADLDA